MNSIDLQIFKLKKEKRVGLMTHFVVGYPTFYESKEVINILLKEGCDLLELQIPFSDPISDGQTIMEASEIALKNRVNTDRVFETAYDFSKQYDTPIIIMAYYNQLFRYGVEKFCRKASISGVSGLIVPDIPPEEEIGEGYIKSCLKYNLYPIRVISPASSSERLRINSKIAHGFIYCVSHFGVTGSKTDIGKEFVSYIKRVRSYTHLPLAVGFGISNPEQIRKIKDKVDIVIVGSAIIEQFKRQGKEGVRQYIRSLLV